MSFRRRGNTTTGGSFDAATVQAVWEKGRVAPGRDPKSWRRDSCGALIYRFSYGDTDSQNGWEIDHILPVSKGGSDGLNNLQPLQWQNNRHKGDDSPNWACLIRA
ncbi:MAG: HNH endonuclease [Lewinellaceae bacterium]|nr:HNH endonuclease [Lewinellaceae bacterium]